MTSAAQRLSERLRSQDPSLPDAAARATARMFLDDHGDREPTPAEWRRLRQAASIQAVEWATENKDGPEPPRPILGGSPLAQIAGTLLWEGVEPTVQEARWEVTGDHLPPFTPDAYASEAVPWLGQVHGEDRRLRWSAEDADDVQRLASEGQEVAAELERLTGRTWRFEDADIQLEYRDAEGHLRHLFVTRKDRLWPIAEAAAHVSRATGNQVWQVVQYILCGTRPPAPRASIQLVRHDRGYFSKIERQEVLVTFLVPDLSRTDLGDLYAMITDAWVQGGIEAAESREDLSEDDVLLHRIVRHHRPDFFDRDNGGRMPHGFWDRVREDWIANGGRPLGKHALQMRVRRLRPKLNRALPVTIKRQSL